MSTIFGELKRRNVFKVAAAYLVVSWLILQVANTIFPTLALPDWTLTFVTLLLILGFPIACLFAWAFELTPEGLKKSKDVPKDESMTGMTGRKLDFIIIGTLIIVIGILLADPFAKQEQTVVTEQGVVKSSIAVLPFVDMSEDGSQAYLGDGISEEILNLLARYRGLKVAARTSAFSFRGQQKDIRHIGEVLGVATVLEGSIRRDGDTIRITAQLIDAVDGKHLWSETYTRKMDSVFALQDEIADKILEALLPKIISDPDTAIIKSASAEFNPTAEEVAAYMKAREKFLIKSPSTLKEALALVEPIAKKYPNASQLQAFYARVLMAVSSRRYGDVPWIQVESKVKRSIKIALAENPGMCEAHAAKGEYQEANYDINGAIKSYERALDINPSRIDTHLSLAKAYLNTGQQQKAWSTYQQAKAIDPVSPSTLGEIAHVGTAYDKPKMAADAFNLLKALAPQSASHLEGELLLDQGKVAEALIAMEDHRARYKDTSNDDRLFDNYLKLGLYDQAIEISPRGRIVKFIAEGKKIEALVEMKKQAAEEDDPHDKTDIYWMTYFSLGMNNEAMISLLNLWNGYASQQMGPRMGGLDVGVMLLLAKESDNRFVQNQLDFIHSVYVKSVPNDVHPSVNSEAIDLLFKGKVDDAVKIIEGRAKANNFPAIWGIPYLRFYGIESHSSYPELQRLFAAWKAANVDRYKSLHEARKTARS